MEITDENLHTLSNYLMQTLSPDPNVRRPAERFLESIEINKNYPILLLHLINKEEVHFTIRVAGAITFKNYTRRNWPINDDNLENKIDPEDRIRVKELIVDVMLVAPSSIQKQLSEAVGTIGKCDFPKDWPGLLTNMVEKFGGGDFHVINGILQTAHSIFKRYRYEFKSQKLWEEIKFVLDTFAKPLTDLAVATQNLTQVHAANPEALRVIYSSLLLISKIFYSLNFQDLPEFFEDNMNVWMPLFHTLLTTDVKCLQTDDDEEAGILEQLRSQVCSNVSLYAQKYDEEFQPYLQGFVTDIWSLLVTVSLQPKNDLLVSNALQFLSTIAERQQYRHLFEDKNVLTGICEKVIIPNIHFRDSDLELFEDNPEEYIRKDIEGSDVESRRRSSSELVKVLAGHFPETVRTIFGTRLQEMLTEYNSDPAKWRLKNTAVYIVTSLAERGSTAKHGVTKSSDLVDLHDFAGQYIIPELKKEVNTLPVIKADSIKYLITFRSLLAPQVLIAALPDIVKHLTSPSLVVHSYAASAIDRLLTLKQNNQPLITQALLQPIAGDILTGLFNILNFKGSEENEYVMKAIMRSFHTLDESVIPFLAELLPKLTQKLTIVAKNPSRPHFNHYLFETISLSIRIVCKNNPGAVSAFEEALFPTFQIIFQEDVQEFVPYCMQVLSLTLARRSPPLPPPYVALYPCLLSPQLWDRPGCVRGLVCLLRSYVRVSSNDDFNQTVKVNGLLGVFQKLISSRLNDHEGFYLMQSLIEHCPRELLDPFMKQVVLLLFQRLTAAKTTKYVKGLITFFCLLVIKYGAPTFIELVDSVQPQMFSMVVERLITPDCRKVSGSVERKITAVGLCRLVADSKQVFSGPYSACWPALAKSVVEILEAPEDDSVAPEDHFVEVDNLPGYEPAYVHLTAVGNDKHDPISDVTDLRREFAHGIRDLFQVSGQIVTQAIASLGEPYASHIKRYLVLVGVNL
ncbi:exportin-2 [Halyomorpha halys]|uniref:exportin-2 n=1 Tax=Halyomorpha halys TaxID=286706 RepID=UPI0006D4F676|nr:exportin-2 [Halyomorpha halys]